MKARSRFLAADAVLAVLLAAIGILGTTSIGRYTDTKVDGVAIGLVVFAALTLTVRRIWPIATLAAATLTTSAYLLSGYPYGPILLSFLVAVYSAARHLPFRTAALAVSAALPVLVAHVFTSDGPGLIGLIPAAAWIVVPFAVGTTVRQRREAAVRSREELVRQHAADERLRIAQEVHDVVGHGLSAIHMQAEVALHLLAKQPQQAEAALSAISRTSQEALDELRVTLGVVRSGSPADDRAPMPGLARLDDLVARMSESGLQVRTETQGRPRPLPSAIDLAAYRVVQEALTNVLRHAGPADATVRIGYEDREVTVEVTDTGRGGSATAAPGQGIDGMRQRVTALGGTFAAGPAAQGFRVFARLPLT